MTPICNYYNYQLINNFFVAEIMEKQWKNLKREPQRKQRKKRGNDKIWIRSDRI